ncbi:complement decay-accelerating factor isoform 2-T2 [Symphorus nematophorus]
MDILLDTCGRRRVKHLLLLCLFALKAAADCSKPEGKNNTVLTSEALLLNAFPDGIVVPFECANGYFKESGSGVTTCINGNWTELDLICNKKDCGPPPPQPHMNFDTSPGTLFGAVIEVFCDKGYSISGSSFKQCFAQGWSGRAKCEIVICDKPDQPANGKFIWDSEDEPKYGEIIQYICNEGYTLVGNDSIKCTETGEYNSGPPECKGVTTEGRMTTTVTQTPTPPAQEASTFAAASPTAHRDKTLTTSATPTVSPSPPGGRDILAATRKATPASITSTTPFQDKHDGAVDMNKDIGYTPLIVSVISVTLVVSILVFLTHKFLLRRKGRANGTEPICEHL